MRSITARFLLSVLVFSAAFCALLLYETWSSTRARVEEVLAREAELALEFDLAIREYIADYVRPSMEERVEPGAFYPETMSTSYVARSVFDRVRQKFPKYIIKFSSLNPRNPANMAGPEERRVIEHFQMNPEATRWAGRVTMEGREYYARFSPRRMETRCMRCHGEPADAPATLVERYGPEAGFHVALGDVSLDTVAIPFEEFEAAIGTQTRRQIWLTVALIFLLSCAVLLTFRRLVTRRLAEITSHLDRAAPEAEEGRLSPLPVKGVDEIGAMTDAFNGLVRRLTRRHDSLEQRILARTGELEHEVAERKRAEEALRDSEQRLAFALEAADDGVFDWEFDIGNYYFSPRCLAMLGYDKDDLPNRLHAWRRLVHPQDLPRVLEMLRRHFADSSTHCEVDFRLKTKTGAWKWIQGRGRVVERTLLGRPRRMVGTCTDISERKGVEEEQRRRLRRIRKFSATVVRLAKSECVAQGRTAEAAALAAESVAEAVEAERVSVWLHNDAGTEMECLDLYVRTPGKHSSGAILLIEDHPAYFAALESERAIDVYDTATDPRTRDFAENYTNPLGIGAMLDAGIRIEGKVVGVVCVEHVGGPRLWQSSELGFASEIADQMATTLLNARRIAVERERQELEVRFQHAQKLEGLGLLAGGIAHDFNNLLMAIVGNVELAIQEGGADSKSRQYLDNIEAASRHAADLCRQMLAYSGRGQTSVRSVCLTEVVKDILQLLRSSISKKIELLLQVDDELPATSADIAQIQQLILNLITNASDAIGDAPGVITVRTGKAFCDEAEIARSLTGELVARGEYVFLEVRDTGCGMDERTQARIFEPFFTTKPTGRGLGLAAVVGIVRAHDGIMTVESTPGQGTAFTVRLPIGCQEPQAEAARIPRVEGDFSGKTVLLADDEAPVRMAVGKILERAGFEVIEARDGHDAVDVFRENAGRIDCVVLDITMPRMNGKEAFREMVKIRDDISVVFASGFDDQGITESLVSHAKTDFVQKPYRGAELLNRLRRLLDR